MAQELYNPLDKRRLAESVAKALLEQDAGPLPPPRPFSGAGIYAIYYTGAFESYRPLSEKNQGGRFEAPIYVGKAIPPGRRKGGLGLEPTLSSVLYNRLTEHAESIGRTVNLYVNDFACRHLVVDEVWIPLAEAMLIAWFSPLWNVLVDGFGNHDPGKGRYNQQKSVWDVLHPGRPWAERLQPNRRNEERILQTVVDYFSRAK